MSKMEETFNISDVKIKYFTFGQVVLRGNFSAGGKLSLQKLCRNKHFSAAGTISLNSKRETLSCSSSIILLNHKLGLFK